jgi:hypothetical protein
MDNQLIHFGKLSLLYEDGFVRYIRTGETEVLRKIYFALRDSNWVTADIVRSDERISVTWKGFEISYTATNVVDNKEVFRWLVRIHGNDKNEIDFSVDGEALAEYNRNRAGICVLHPIRETKAKIVKVTRPDGSVYEDKFPSLINPHQPFKDITKMLWQLDDTAWAEVEFEGDVFETEDQRNWGDTSFKTYSTPLAIPYPVLLKRGDKVSQRARMKLVNGDGLPSSDVDEDIEVTIDESDSKPFPAIGTDFPGEIASKTEIELLSRLAFYHVHIELRLSSPSWKEKLENGLEQARQLSAREIVHVVIGDVGEWDEFEREVSSLNLSFDKLAISPVDRKANVDALLQYTIPRARKLFGKITIGAGFTSYFTELNRNRFNYSLVDFLIYSLNPQVHATDSHTIIENLPAQTDALKTANVFAPGKAVHVGPVTLKPRFNPDAKPGTAEDSDSRFDPRQQTPLAAGWAMASIKYLSEGGADSITLFESHGLAGYLSEHHPFPVYNALLRIQELKPKRVIRSDCNEQLVVTSLVVEDEKSQRHLILINHTNSKKYVSLGERHYTLSDFEIQINPLK